MLPAWAQFLVAIAGGAVGGLLATVLRIRHEREEQLRDRMVAAADDFATAARHQGQVGLWEAAAAPEHVHAAHCLTIAGTG